jgi:hypothetical protein
MDYSIARPSRGDEIRVEEFELQMGYSDAFEYLNNVLGAHSSDNSSSQGPTSGMSRIEPAEPD